MARKLARIVRVSEVSRHPDADRLDVCMVGGWRVVTARDEIRPGDEAVYFEIDSALPADDDRYGYLHTRCLKRFRRTGGRPDTVVVRIRTAKIRGVLSQGLLMPRWKFSELLSFSVGDDVTSVLRVIHYDELFEEVSAERHTGGGGDRAKANRLPKAPAGYPMEYAFPRTDQERVQNIDDVLRSGRYAGLHFEVTEKLDGSSMTVCWLPTVRPDSPIALCSRNLEVSVDGDGKFARAFRDFALGRAVRMMSELCFGGHDIALQGELTGPGINGNRAGRGDFCYNVFDVFDVTLCRFAKPADVVAACATCGVPHVPVIDPMMPYDAEVFTSDGLLAMADGASVFSPHGNPREGLVFKCVEDPSIHFKAVSNRYLLRETELVPSEVEP